MRVFIGIHILLAVVNHAQRGNFRAARAGKAFQRFGGRTVFHARRHRRAFFHHSAVGLHGFNVFHLHGQAARRGISSEIGLAVDQLLFFQRFGHRSGQAVAQQVEGFGRQLFGAQFD